MSHRLGNISWLAARDYRDEWQMSGFFVLALAAVLGPMMVLFGLKFGIISSMVDNLVEDPRNREVRPIGSGHFDRAGWRHCAADPMSTSLFLVPALSPPPSSSKVPQPNVFYRPR